MVGVQLQEATHYIQWDYYEYDRKILAGGSEFRIEMIFPYQHITLSSKPIMTFLKEHRTGGCWFDTLSRAKVTLLLSFTY